MSIKVKQMLCPETKKSIKFPYFMNPTRIVVHNTANDASAQNEITYMCNNNDEVSFHFAVDDKEVVQGLLLNANGWHAGDDNGKGNREGIAIEICYSKSGGSRFIAAEKLAAKFIAQLLNERGWGIDRVTKHQDYSGKYCPHRTLDMGWDRFLNMIKTELNSEKIDGTKVEINDLVKIASNAIYYTGKSIPDWVKDLNWYVSSISGDRAVINKSEDGKYFINSPINIKFLSIVSKCNNSLTSGRQITLNKCSIYMFASAPNDSGKITGTYYLWDTNIINDRIRITNSRSNVGKPSQVTGWIKIENIN